MVGIRWTTLVEDKQTGELRCPNRDEGETGGISLMVTGYVPYENIESVDWDGDRYYSCPHVYCYFNYKGEPYERLAFFEQRTLDEYVYFTKVDDYKKVLKRGKKGWWQRVICRSGS